MEREILMKKIKKISLVLTILTGVLLSSISPALAADTTVKQSINRSKAVELAIAHSKDLSNSTLDVDKATSIDNATNFVQGTYEPDLIKSKNSTQIDKTWAAKQVTIKKETLAYDTEKQMDELLLLRKEATLSDKKLQLKKDEYGIIRIKAMRGAESEYNLSTAADELQQLEKDNAVLKISLEEAEADFAKLIGQEVGTYTLVEDPLSYQAMQEVNISSLVTSRLYDDPYLWYYDKKIDTAELDLKLYAYTDATPYKAQEISVTQAKLDVEEIKDNLRTSMRTNYNSIRSQEEAYTSLVSQLEKARKDLALAEKKYALGVNKNVDVETARVAVAELEYDLQKNINEHNYLVKVLEKPYLSPTYTSV